MAKYQKVSKYHENDCRCDLMRKINWIGNFMTSQPDQQSILKHILSNILRSKGNQKIKLGQLIEYNIGNIFLEKSCTKCDVVTSPFKK